jgi:hypothetical protein
MISRVFPFIAVPVRESASLYLRACRLVITTQYYECLRLGLSVRLVHIIRQ